MKKEDIYAPPHGDSCAECRAAGVENETRVRHPQTGVLRHGFELKRHLELQADFMRKARAAVGPKGRRGRMEKLVSREPGREG
jgi:hypothetical protein